MNGETSPIQGWTKEDKKETLAFNDYASKGLTPTPSMNNQFVEDITKQKISRDTGTSVTNTKNSENNSP